MFVFNLVRPFVLVEAAGRTGPPDTAGFAVGRLTTIERAPLNKQKKGGTPMGGQRCARPGCRAWAMRGRSFCRAHRRQEQDGSDAELADREEGRDPAVFESLPESLISPNLVTTQVEALLTKIREIEGSELTLREEIGVLRL